MAQFENPRHNLVGAYYYLLSVKQVEEDYFTDLRAGEKWLLVLFTENFNPTLPALESLFDGSTQKQIRIWGDSPGLAVITDSITEERPGIMVEITVLAGDDTTKAFDDFLGRLDRFLSSPLKIEEILAEVRAEDTDDEPMY